MKRCNGAKIFLLVILIASSLHTAFAQESLKNWYWVQVSEGSETQFYRGTSSLDEVALLDALNGDGFLRFENLVFVKCGEIKDWSNHNPELKNHVFINPKFVISVHPLSGDPRSTRKQSGPTGCTS